MFVYRMLLAPLREGPGGEAGHPLAERLRLLLAAVVAGPGPGSEQEENASRPSRCGRSGARPARSGRACRHGASISSPPARNVAAPSTTTIQACSLTWWSPSSWPGIEPDQNGPRLVLAAEDDRRAAATRRLDLREASRSPSPESSAPEGNVTRAWAARNARVDSPPDGPPGRAAPAGRVSSPTATSSAAPTPPRRSSSTPAGPGRPRSDPRRPGRRPLRRDPGDPRRHRPHRRRRRARRGDRRARVHARRPSASCSSGPDDFLPAGIDVTLRATRAGGAARGRRDARARRHRASRRCPSRATRRAHLAFAADGASSPATSSSPARSAARPARARAGRRSLELDPRRSSSASRPRRSSTRATGPATTLERELATNPFLGELRAPAR